MSTVPRRPDLGSHSLGHSSYEADLPRRQSSHLSNDVRHPQPEDDSHGPQTIVITYDRLKQRIMDFKDQLGVFLRECRQLGRSYALILAARDLREGLEKLLSMFHENATYLAPSLLEGGSAMSLNAINKPFYFWLEALAEVCDTFRERLNEFREYTDESAKVKALMMMFSKHLMYRASCLQDHKDSLNTTYIRRYINDLADEMGNDLDNLVSAFKFFNQYGMPAMQYEQRRATEMLLTMSTVSTFFSAVTATTLQTSLSIQANSESNPLISVVNTFWFCSLVLSIGSALNSLLAALWKRTPYGSRGRRLPVWVTVWIHTSAPAFLAISIASFSAGLVLFAYSSGQKSHTKIVTLATTAATSFGLFTTAAWFGYEQYIAPLLLPNAPWRPFGKRIHEWKSSMAENSHLVLPDHYRTRTGSLSDCSIGSRRSSSSFNLIPHKLSSRLPVSEILNKVPGLRRERDTSEQNRSLGQEDHPAHSPTSDEAGNQTRMRLGRIAKLALTLERVSNAFKQRPHNAAISVTTDATPTRTPVGNTIPVKSPSFASIPYKPFKMIPFSGAIQDIEYSPNGEYLAATYYDEEKKVSTTVLYPATGHDMPTHTHSLRLEHISWSSDSRMLLVRSSHSVDFLDKNCHLISTVKRPHLIQSAIWISSSDVFLSVERSTVFRLTIHGDVQGRHRFDHLLLRDVAVVPGSSLLLVTGRVMHHRDGIVPRNSRAEKQIILYDQRTQQSLSHHPVLDDIRYIRISRSITRARDGFDILLSHKNGPSPRLWTLQRQISEQHPSRLVPGTIGLHPAAELSGHGHFIGEGDQMIACVGLDGDVHIWDRETARLICRIPVYATGKGVRCFTWSTASATFASADNEKKELNIWSIVHSEDREDGSPAIRVQSEVPETPGNGATPGLSVVLGTPVTFDEPSGSMDP